MNGKIKIVECVPNFSEGRNEKTINAISSAVEGTSGAKLLDVHSDKDYNRSVLTFAGEPRAVLGAAFNSVKKASELIDMRSHSGEHPCVGAIDVVPFVPVRGTTMEECVSLARELGEKVASVLGIPVYLYARAAEKPERKELAEIRKGGYEALAEKIREEKWRPDFGSAEFSPKSGACIVGARDFLIAFNVDLDTGDAAKAGEIASAVREFPRGLGGVRAIGVFLKERGIAQVSTNLLDFERTGMHQAFEAVKSKAGELGCNAVAGEVIGMVPRKALLDAGRFYSHASKERELIEAAIRGLKLRDFSAEKRIIENRV